MDRQTSKHRSPVQLGAKSEDQARRGAARWAVALICAGGLFGLWSASLSSNEGNFMEGQEAVSSRLERRWSAPAQGEAAAAEEQAARPSPWFEDQRMVTLREGDIAELADELGLELLRRSADGRAGVVRGEAGELDGLLREDPRVLRAGRHGRLVGAQEAGTVAFSDLSMAGGWAGASSSSSTSSSSSGWTVGGDSGYGAATTSSSAGYWETGLGGYGEMPIGDGGAGWDTGRGTYSGLGLGYAAPLPDVRELQWHLDSSETAEDLVDPAGVVVAVVDTGVSCSFSWDEQGYYVGAQSLWASSCWGGWDFVNGDWNPADDHQHGTMMASIIAGSGPAWGMAPGVSLMPIKVLDEHNSGYEWDLIQGIHHAVAGGADVISMSLSFGLGYVPSPELLEAIEVAHEAGVAMVAATGNDGEGQVAWPAASPRVISVGSHCAGLDSDDHVLANYSNWGAKVDVVATGGCLEREVMIGAGWPDGILAESIGLNDPLSTELWFGAGTSEATAVVAGALAQLMASGATSQEAVLLLQEQANTLSGRNRHLGGAGAGAARAKQAVQDLVDPATLAPSTAPVHASLLPWLKDNGNGTVTPRAWVTVWRNGTTPVAGERVVAQLWGNTSGIVSCTLSTNGTCELVGPSIAKADKQAWLFQVAALTSGNVARRPLPMFFANDGLERVVQGVATQSDLQGAVLGLYWPGGNVGGLGTTAPSYTVVDTGSGIATSPMGLIVTKGLVEESGVTTRSLVGGGISTSPFGVRITTLDLGGSGISTSPFGVITLPIISVDGRGIATSPMSAAKTLVGSSRDTSCSTCRFRGEVVLLDQGEIVGESYMGSALQTRLDAGGFVSYEGLGGASAVSGMVQAP